MTEVTRLYEPLYLITDEDLDDYDNVIYREPLGYCKDRDTAEYLVDNMASSGYVVAKPIYVITKDILNKRQRFFLTSQKLTITRVDGYFKIASIEDIKEDTLFDAITKEKFENKGLFDGKMNLETTKINKNNFTLSIGEFSKEPIDVDLLKQKVGTYINKVNFVLKHLREAGIKSTKEVQENLLQLQ